MKEITKVDKIHIKQMHELLGTKPHKLDRVFLEQLIRSNVNEFIDYQGKEIRITFRIKALAEMLLKIIDRV